MSEELVVRAEQAVATVKPHRTRETILKPLGITDNPELPLARVIKDYIKSCGVTKPSEINAEYLRILKDDLQVVIDLRIRQAVNAGYLMELRPGKLNAKTGEEGRFSVGFIPPKTPKKLTISEQQKLVAMLGGKDSAKAKELMEYLESTGRLAKPTTREAEAEVTQVTQPETK